MFSAKIQAMKTIRKKIEQVILESLKDLNFNFKNNKWRVEVPNNKEHGDYASNVCLVLSEEESLKPIEFGEKLRDNLLSKDYSFIKEVSITPPGFLNFTLSFSFLEKKLKEIIATEEWGVVEVGDNQKTQVEFISANPTGPLTLGNGRGGFLGDVLGNVLQKAGFKTEKEYYINDSGNQIKQLGHSVLKDDQATYQGDYIEELHKKISGDDPQTVGEKAAAKILDNIKNVLQKIKIKFDQFFSEKTLHKSGLVDKIIKQLKDNGYTYKKEGALWFKTTEFGDDKDRVLITSDNNKTYLTTDIAYHVNKIKDRNFEKVIDIWGADHQGHVLPLKAGLKALGLDAQKLEFIIVQWVSVLKDGEVFKMSKREGTYWTLEELVEEVGLDAARYFFINRNPSSHLEFDLDLAKKKSNDNPVYYIQYAHTRIASIFRNLDSQEILKEVSQVDYKTLKKDVEKRLIKELLRYPEVITDITHEYQVQYLSQYAYDLAQLVHQFYRDCRVLEAPEKIKKARLGLLLATQKTLQDVLNIMGIEAPQKM